MLRKGARGGVTRGGGGRRECACAERLLSGELKPYGRALRVEGSGIVMVSDEKNDLEKAKREGIASCPRKLAFVSQEMGHAPRKHQRCPSDFRRFIPNHNVKVHPYYFYLRSRESFASLTSICLLRCLRALSAANFKELKNQPKVRSEVMNDKGIGREEFSGVLVSCRFSFLVEGYVFFLISGISGFGQLSKNTRGNYFTARKVKDLWKQRYLPKLAVLCG